MRLPARRRLYAIVLFFLLITSLQQFLQAGASTAPPPAHGGPDLGQGDWVGMATTDATWADYTVDVHFTIVKEAASVYFRTQGGAANSYMWQVNVTGSVPILKKHVWAGGGVSAVTATPLDKIIGQDAIHAPHDIRITADGDTITTFVDGIEVDTTQESAYATGSIGFRESPTEEATYRDLTVTSASGKKLFSDAFAPGEQNAFSAGSIGADGLDVTNASAMLKPDNQTTRPRGSARSSRCERRSRAPGCTPRPWEPTR